MNLDPNRKVTLQLDYLAQIEKEELFMLQRPRGDLPILIFVDRTLFEKNVHLVWFMVNTSHIVQPLDGTPYATLKPMVKKARDDESLKRVLTGESQNQVVSKVLAQTEREAFSKEVVISGFRDRGIWPFDKELLLKRGEKEYLHPTPTDPTVNEAQLVFTSLLNKNTESTSNKVQVKFVSGIPEKNRLYTPTQLIKYNDDLK